MRGVLLTLIPGADEEVEAVWFLRGAVLLLHEVQHLAERLARRHAVELEAARRLRSADEDVQHTMLPRVLHHLPNCKHSVI